MKNSFLNLQEDLGGVSAARGLLPHARKRHILALLKIWPERGIDGREEAAGGLGIEENILIQPRELSGKMDMGAQVARVTSGAAGHAASFRVIAHIGEQR